MRLLIADDHDLLRDALRSHLERALPGTEVLGAGTVDAALGMLAARPDIDLLLLDLRMPGMNGLDGLSRIRDAHPTVKIALMSGEAGPADIRAALARGALGFLPKTLPGEAMVDAVRRLSAGEGFVPDGAAAPPSDIGLTRREREVLDFLLKGLSNKEIARLLDLEEVTVKLHVRGLCRKLDAKNRTQAAMRAVELGLAR